MGRADAGELDFASVRREFPAFTSSVHGRPLVYLDSASTTQKPWSVIDAVRDASMATANVHRGAHTLSVRATEAFESVRARAARRLGAADPREVVFVRGTTEALNLVAQAYGRCHVGAGDEVLVTELEHHSNIVPWQMLCAEKGARLRVLPIDDRGDVRLDRLDELLGPRTRIVSLAHVSNSLGTVLPVGEITRRAKAAGAIVVLDGAQAAAHLPIDVGAIGCDFYAFSAHKAYGPTGAGVLWGRRPLLEAMPPWQGGGEMVAALGFDQPTYREVPYKFEAGTPDVLGVIGLGAALEWLEAKGLARVIARERSLLAYAGRALASIRGVRPVGQPRERAGVFSFIVEGVHPHDVASVLDLEGVAVRAGHHCAQPVAQHYGVEATVRASIAAYSNEADVDELAAALERARDFLRGNR